MCSYLCAHHTYVNKNWFTSGFSSETKSDTMASWEMGLGIRRSAGIICSSAKETSLAAKQS